MQAKGQDRPEPHAPDQREQEKIPRRAVADSKQGFDEPSSEDEQPTAGDVARV